MSILHDADIREPLFDFLEETYGKIRILEEKVIGRSRADVVMVTESALCGLEIKSDADSYARLERQVKDYDRFHDYNFAVVGTSHALHIREHVPEYWGVITVEEVDGKVDFYLYRQPQASPKTDFRCKLQILWRPELVLLQEILGMPKYKGKSKDFVIGKITERMALSPDRKNHIDRGAVNRAVSDILMERDYNDIAGQLREYRKGKIQKRLDAETDPAKRLELFTEQFAAKNTAFTRKHR